MFLLRFLEDFLKKKMFMIRRRSSLKIKYNKNNSSDSK